MAVLVFICKKLVLKAGSGSPGPSMGVGTGGGLRESEEEEWEALITGRTEYCIRGIRTWQPGYRQRPLSFANVSSLIVPVSVCLLLSLLVSYLNVSSIKVPFVLPRLILS